MHSSCMHENACKCANLLACLMHALHACGMHAACMIHACSAGMQSLEGITGDIIFCTRSLESFGNKHLASDMPTLFSLAEKQVKSAKRVIEPLIKLYIYKRRAFHRLNH